MIQRPRGTRDFIPADMERRRFYEGILRDEAKIFGFKEIATPIFEEAELFVVKSGPNILNEIYAFKDKGDRDIALRPELTAPVMRMYINELSNEPKPLKLFYFGQCFRYERPQSGRYREFFQFGAELVGAANPESDAEVIALAASMIKSLGLKDYRMRIGHIGILKQRILDAGIDAKNMPEVLQKLDKKLYDEAEVIMTKYGVSKAVCKKIFDLTETVGGKEVLDKVKDEASDYLREVVETLEKMGVDDIEIDMGVVRGLDYYTGMVFEAEAPALGAEKQICGGGSYSLTELFGGEKVFSTGFAIGFDRALLALEKEGTSVEPETVDIYVVPVSDDVRGDAISIASELREKGIATEMDLMRRKMQKAMKHASSIGAKYVVIVGAKELAEDSVTLRDMSTGDQKLVKIDDISDNIY